MWCINNFKIRSSIIKLSNVIFTSLLILTTAVWAGEAEVVEVDIKKLVVIHTFSR